MKAKRQQKTQQTPIPTDTKPNITQEQLDMLIKRLDELENRPPAPGDPTTATTTTISQGGRVIGTIDRFPMDASYYPNPVEDLYDTPELKRFALRDNFLLDFRVDTQSAIYETKWGTTVREPIFNVTLFAKKYDEYGDLEMDDNGGTRLIKAQVLKMTEDELAAQQIAQELGIKASDSRQLMNEVRLERIKRWLIAWFMPSSPLSQLSQEKDEIIDGIVYTTTSKVI